MNKIDTKLNLNIPNSIDYLHIVQSFVKESALLYKLEDSVLSKLPLIAEEAFSYILKTSFDDEEKSSVKVAVGSDKFYFRVSFFDLGLPVDESITTQYKPLNIDKISTDGIELFFLKKFVDELQWVNHGGQGKELRLLFYIPYSDITSIKEHKTEVDKRKIDPDDLEVRPMRSEDAVEISRTIYRTYGYTYPNEDLYYPEKIIELNRSGNLISVVSVDKKTKKVVGHYALECPNLISIAEIGQAVVSPSYRGFDLMARMRAVLEKKARELKLEGIVAQPVTSHLFSQKVNIKNGLSVCGIAFGLVPKELSFKKIKSEKLTQRETCMLYFQALCYRKRVLSIPFPHKEVIKRIYSRLGFTYTLLTNAMPTTDGNIKTKYYSSWGYGVITVVDLGAKNIQDIKNALNHLRFEMSADVIFLYISLERAVIDRLVEDVQKIGFFFCGVVPSFLEGEDALRFEYLNTKISLDNIEIEGEDAKELVRYINTQRQRVMS